MDKISKYKQMYLTVDNKEEITFTNGRFEVPMWLQMLLLDSSGIKSKKKRVVKKIIKKQLTKMLLEYVELQSK